MKMKNITTAGILTAILSCPAMAEVNVDITAGTNNPGCNNTVLHTYSGPTQLEAEYTANTINLKWYDADGEITTVPNASKTCTYDGAITLPTTNPTRTGYTFAGWQVKGNAAAVVQRLRNLINVPNTVYLSGIIYEKSGICNFADGNGSSFGYGIPFEEGCYGLSYGQWIADFEELATIKGESLCSATPGETRYTTGNPNTSQGGQYCWCHATGLIDNFETVNETFTPAESPYVFAQSFANENTCLANCVSSCAKRAVFDLILGRNVNWCLSSDYCSGDEEWDGCNCVEIEDEEPEEDEEE